MTPTSINKGIWSLDGDETGLLTQSISYDFQADSGEVRNYQGYVVGKTYYNETISISIDGKYDSDTPFAAELATVLTLVDSIPDHIADITNGCVIIEGITVNKDQGDYQGVSISATYYPNMDGTVQVAV